MKIPSLYIGPSTLAGRGVFATEDIPAGSVIEICPIVPVPRKEIKHLKKTILLNYYFEWGRKARSAAIVLGYGSLYNHSFAPNARYYSNIDDNTLDIVALEDIPVGKEITVNYNGEPEDQSPIWFLEEE